MRGLPATALLVSWLHLCRAAQTVSIAATDTQIRYITGPGPDKNSSWTRIPASPSICPTPQQATERVGDHAIFTFIGTEITVFGTIGVKRGIIGFSLDGKNTTFDRTNASRLECEQPIFKKTNLPFQRHTLVATLLQKQSSQNKGSGILSLQRISFTVPDSTTTKPNPSNSTASSPSSSSSFTIQDGTNSSTTTSSPPQDARSTTPTQTTPSTTPTSSSASTTTDTNSMQTDGSTKKENTNNLPTIIGASVGSGFLVIIAILLLWFFKRRREFRRRNRTVSYTTFSNLGYVPSSVREETHLRRPPSVSSRWVSAPPERFPEPMEQVSQSPWARPAPRIDLHSPEPSYNHTSPQPLLYPAPTTVPASAFQVTSRRENISAYPQSPTYVDNNPRSPRGSVYSDQTSSYGAPSVADTETAQVSNIVQGRAMASAAYAPPAPGHEPVRQNSNTSHYNRRFSSSSEYSDQQGPLSPPPLRIHTRTAQQVLSPRTRHLQHGPMSPARNLSVQPPLASVVEASPERDTRQFESERYLRDANRGAYRGSSDDELSPEPPARQLPPGPRARW